MASLVTIADLQDFPKALLQLCSVKDRIEKFLEDINVDPVKLHGEFDMGSLGRRNNIFHASMIGSNSGKSVCGKYPMGCGRELYYSFIGANKEGAWQPRVRRILDTGTAVHTQLQTYLEEISRQDSTFNFSPEVDVNPDANDVADMMDISGHTDGECHSKEGEDEVRFLLEIKTINDAGYKKLSSPHPEHLVQGTIYQACMDCPVIVFLYYNKNDSSMAEYIHLYDHDRWIAITRKLNMVRDTAMNDEVPDRELSYQCSRCGYQKTCKPPRRGKSATRAAAKLLRGK